MSPVDVRPLAVEEINVAKVLSYLEALEAAASGSEVATFFTEDAVQIEMPSKLNPRGGSSDLAALLARVDTGQTLLAKQRYEVRSVVAQQDRVAVEALWCGTLGVPFDGLAAGDTMRAHFAMFFEMVDGKIKLQRNYDCFEAAGASQWPSTVAT